MTHHETPTRAYSRPVTLTLTLLSLVTLGASVALSGCGSTPISSQNLFGSLSDAQSETFSGDLSLNGLTPTSKLGEDVLVRDLGRTVIKGDVPKLVKPNACHDLLPRRKRDNLRERIGSGFDMYLLRTLKERARKLAFTKLEHEVPVLGEHKTGDVVSAHLKFTRIMGFVSEDDLKLYDKCCALTGSCGAQMLAKLYGAEVDARYLSPTDLTLQTSLRAFDQEPGALLNAQTFDKLARSVYTAQASKKRAELPQQIWTHFDYRALPQPSSIDLKGVQLEVTSLLPVFCKPKKSKQTDVIELTISLKGTESAGELLGYKISVSKLWDDTTLSSGRGPVKLTDKDLSCYPKRDAIAGDVDAQCPTRVKINVVPPICKGKDDQEIVWDATVALYAPGDEDHTPYHEVKTETRSLIKGE